MELIIKSDWLYVMDNVLTPEQCKELMDIAEDKMHRSTTIGKEITGYRTSSNCYLPKDSEDEVVKITNTITEYLTDLPIENQEDICIVKYNKGEEYKEHYDWLVDDPSDEGKMEMLRGGDRMYTVMFYLNDGFEDIGESFHLVFSPLDVDLRSRWPLSG